MCLLAPMVSFRPDCVRRCKGHDLKNACVFVLSILGLGEELLLSGSHHPRALVKALTHTGKSCYMTILYWSDMPVKEEEKSCLLTVTSLLGCGIMSGLVLVWDFGS